MDLSQKTTDPEMRFRFVPSPENPKKLTLILDKERDGDLIINNGRGEILLLSPEVTAALTGIMLDYVEGSGFRISRQS